MSIINFKPSIDPPVHVCESLVSLAQGLAIVTESVVQLDVTASSRTDITEALSRAIVAIHQAAMAIEGAYCDEAALAGQLP